MNEVGFQREIFTFLKTGYGITDAQIVPGGKHMALTFTGNGGARVKRTWPRYATGGDWGITLENKRKDLIALLGEPAPPPPPRPRMKMEDLMPPLPAATAELIRDRLPSLAAQLNGSPPAEVRQLDGWRVACYAKPKLAVRINVPWTDRRWFSKDHVEVTRLAPDTWRLTPADGGLRLAAKPTDKVYAVQFQINDLTSGLTIFGASPAEARVLVDGSIVVRCPAETRRAFRYSSPIETKLSEPTPVAVEEQPSAPANVEELPPAETGLVATARRCLVLLRHIEATSEYRLARMKDGGGWAFVARIE